MSDAEWTILKPDGDHRLHPKARDDRTWKRINDDLRRRVRVGFEEADEPSAAIIDSQRVTTTDVGGRAIGFDANKKVTGRQRHIAVGR